MSAAPVVLDASAVLALLFREPGHAAVAAVVDGARLSTVNASEVLARLARLGADPADAHDVLRRLPLRLEPFTERHALAAAALAERTRALGLALGDRACLALATDLGARAVTADRASANRPLAVDVVCVR